MAKNPTVYDAFNRPPGVQVDFGYYDNEGVFVPEPSKTKQEFKDECDINLIMARVLESGTFPEGLPVGQYGDFSEVGDYQEALQTVELAREQFASLPAAARDRFGNDPSKFLAWLPTATLEEANKLGLLSDEASKRIAAVPVPEVKPPA